MINSIRFPLSNHDFLYIVFHRALPGNFSDVRSNTPLFFSEVVSRAASKCSPSRLVSRCFLFGWLHIFARVTFHPEHDSCSLATRRLFLLFEKIE